MPRKQSSRVCPAYIPERHTRPIPTVINIVKTTLKRTSSVVPERTPTVKPVPVQNSFSAFDYSDDDSDTESDTETKTGHMTSLSLQKSSKKYAPWTNSNKASVHSSRLWVNMMEEEEEEL